METILIGYATIALFCAGRFTGKDYEEYKMEWRVAAAVFWPWQLAIYSYFFLKILVPLVRKGNIVTSIRVLVFGQNVWGMRDAEWLAERMSYRPSYKKKKVWGWLYRRAFDRLVVMNKDRV